MPEESDLSEKRLEKIENAITKLTDISNNLSQLIAIQDLRVKQQEKETSNIYHMLERRRTELDSRIHDMNVSISDKENKINDNISDLRVSINAQHKCIESKISQIEKFNWITIGAVTVISFVVTTLAKYLKIF